MLNLACCADRVPVTYAIQCQLLTPAAHSACATLGQRVLPEISIVQTKLPMPAI